LRYPKDFLDGLKARVRLSDVVSPYVRLSRSGKYWKGLSPFSKEKTPSFFVDDEKGSYRCFSSDQGGDHFEFLMTTQGLSFQEAVERLAQDAGVELPATGTGQVKQERARRSLLDVLEAAAGFFEMSLADTAGAPVRRYLKTRGLNADTSKTFRLGFAPASYSMLHQHLLAKGFSEDQLMAAGLVRRRRDDRGYYDYFRNRLMFPILDRAGRVVAFGGRALDPDEPAKYLNSPATDLFDKSRILYNFKSAREAYHQPMEGSHMPLVVAEGYMDVIALHDAGFQAAVAPLGTSVTNHHLALLWETCPCPRLCFDGDKAGRAAALRVAELALPLLKPGLSMDFVLLPNGSDPDDIVRQQGPHVLEELIRQSVPLVSVLWDHLLRAADLASPDGKAAFRHRIDQLVSEIAHPTIRDYYRRELHGRRSLMERTEEDRRFGTFRGDPGRSPGERRGNSYFSAVWNGRRPAHRGRAKPSGGPAANRERISEALRLSRLARTPGRDGGREELLLATVLNHPELLVNDLEVFASLRFSNPQLDKLRNQILSTIDSDADLDREGLLAHLTQQGLALTIHSLLGSAVVRANRFAAREAEQSVVEKGWKDLLRRMSSIEMLHNDFLAAQEAFAECETEENWARIVALKAQLQKLESYQDQ